MLIVTMIQVVGVSVIALVITRLYARDWSSNMVPTLKDDEGDRVEHSRLVSDA